MPCGTALNQTLIAEVRVLDVATGGVVIRILTVQTEFALPAPVELQAVQMAAVTRTRVTLIVAVHVMTAQMERDVLPDRIV